VYPEANVERRVRYDTAVILYDEGIGSDLALENNDRISFCGIVDLQRECWKDSSTTCIPFSKPIHIRLESIEKI
jgi:hypothetical protein